MEEKNDKRKKERDEDETAQRPLRSELDLRRSSSPPVLPGARLVQGVRSKGQGEGWRRAGAGGDRQPPPPP